jgi:surfeit locus 1 family protein
VNAAPDGSRPRSSASLALLAVAGVLLFAGFAALGNWQLHRRAWKLDLIQRVDRRVQAAAVTAPGPGEWPGIGRNDEYRRIQAEGRFLYDRQILAQAVTEHGPGFWVMTPLQTHQGFIVLVNRGFVEAGWRDPAADAGHPSPSPVSVSGLLRLSEPKGGFLRHNDPAGGRWYSRDVVAIAAAQQLPLAEVAPYFIDADAGPDTGAQPIGGMTVIRFHNSHLVYAVTWYTLALMVIGAAVIVGRQEWQRRR